VEDKMEMGCCGGEVGVSGRGKEDRRGEVGGVRNG